MKTLACIVIASTVLSFYVLTAKAADGAGHAAHAPETPILKLEEVLADKR